MMSATGRIRRGEPVRPAGILPDARPGSSYLTDDPFGLANQTAGVITANMSKFSVAGRRRNNRIIRTLSAINCRFLRPNSR